MAYTFKLGAPNSKIHAVEMGGLGAPKNGQLELGILHACQAAQQSEAFQRLGPLGHL